MSEPAEIVTEFIPAILQIVDQPQVDYTLKNNSTTAEIKKVYSRGGDFLGRVIYYYKIYFR